MIGNLRLQPLPVVHRDCPPRRRRWLEPLPLSLLLLVPVGRLGRPRTSRRRARLRLLHGLLVADEGRRVLVGAASAAGRARLVRRFGLNGERRLNGCVRFRLVMAVCVHCSREGFMRISLLRTTYPIEDRSAEDRVTRNHYIEIVLLRTSLVVFSGATRN